MSFGLNTNVFVFLRERKKEDIFLYLFFMNSRRVSFITIFIVIITFLALFLSVYEITLIFFLLFTYVDSEYNRYNIRRRPLIVIFAGLFVYTFKAIQLLLETHSAKKGKEKKSKYDQNKAEFISNFSRNPQAKRQVRICISIRRLLCTMTNKTT